jgi:hypothetical protein
MNPSCGCRDESETKYWMAEGCTVKNLAKFLNKFVSPMAADQVRRLLTVMCMVTKTHVRTDTTDGNPTMLSDEVLSALLEKNSRSAFGLARRASTRFINDCVRMRNANLECFQAPCLYP